MKKYYKRICKTKVKIIRDHWVTSIFTIILIGSIASGYKNYYDTSRNFIQYATNQFITDECFETTAQRKLWIKRHGNVKKNIDDYHKNVKEFDYILKEGNKHASVVVSSRFSENEQNNNVKKIMPFVNHWERNITYIHIPGTPNINDSKSAKSYERIVSDAIEQARKKSSPIVIDLRGKLGGAGRTGNSFRSFFVEEWSNSQRTGQQRSNQMVNT